MGVMLGRTSSIDFHDGVFESLGYAGEDLVAIPGHEHVVLDPHATPARDVDSRFNSDHHSGFEDALCDGAQSGFFVNVQPNTMTESVPKKLAVSRVLDHPTGGPIDGF